ncbi:hypothetical protein DFQ29_004257 [Apophysomyces sp. BC1021]|nr:hypothetical protein DFQ29_004257 [Apophysomyces sp. BC1021]
MLSAVRSLTSEGVYMRCVTNYGAPCSHFFVPLRIRGQTCHIFRAPFTFRLGESSSSGRAGNGSRIMFYYYWQTQSPPPSNLRLRVNLYPRQTNPSDEVSDLPSGKQHSLISADNNEQNLFVENSYELDPHVVSTGSYRLTRRLALRDSFWNYVGFAQQTDTMQLIDTLVASEPFRSNYVSQPQPIGSFHLYPEQYNTKILQEQRAFTVINAIGIIGGLFIWISASVTMGNSASMVSWLDAVVVVAQLAVNFFSKTYSFETSYCSPTLEQRSEYGSSNPRKPQYANYPDGRADAYI